MSSKDSPAKLRQQKAFRRAGVSECDCWLFHLGIASPEDPNIRVHLERLLLAHKWTDVVTVGLPEAETGVYGRGTGTQLPLGHETVSKAAIKYVLA